MNRNEHLEFCKICKNQKFDREKGIICELTNSIADFDQICESFDENETLKTQLLAHKAENDLESKVASQGKRFANYILDMIFLIIFNIIFAVIVGIVVGIISPDSLGYFDQIGKIEEYIWGFIIGMIYYSLFEAITGRSIAKFITKTKVVDENGNKPRFEIILLRSLCRFIPFEQFSFLVSNGTGWHDTISKTRVIEIK